MLQRNQHTDSLSPRYRSGGFSKVPHRPELYKGGITKAGNRHIRSLLVESSWHFRYPFVQKSRALKERQQHQETAIVSYADKANNRLTRKFLKMTYRNKSTKTTVVAVAREMSGFVWDSGNLLTDIVACGSQSTYTRVSIIGIRFHHSSFLKLFCFLPYWGTTRSRKRCFDKEL